MNVNPVSILYMLSQTLHVHLTFDCAPLHNSSSKNNPKFLGSFRFGEYAYGKGEGSNKRTAKVHAAVDALIKLRQSAVAGVIENFLNDQKINPASFEQMLSTEENNSQEENSLPDGSATCPAESTDYISKLQALAVNRRWIMPQYDDFGEEKSQGSNPTAFIVKATIVISNRTFNEYGRAGSKKEAKKEAAKKLYLTLESDAKIARGACYENIRTNIKINKKTVSNDKLASLAHYIYKPDAEKTENHKLIHGNASTNTY
ncbi:hypothetical protein TrispH2_000948 [Trichoplax sp. H2]|nr:hypothetical protein TrispH2_000948 [Trichoplax sp. H2]|eukprot:RDD46725.1 hypothetical protein TrispH2_000948 [Trichoplax sp. H2]